MSFKDCINRGVAGGEIDADRARDAVEIFDGLEAEYRGHMTHGEAARLASVDTLAQLRIENIERRRLLLLQTSATQSIAVHMRGFRGGKDYGGAAQALMENFHGGGASSIEARRKSIVGRSHSKIETLLKKHKLGLLAQRQDRAGLREIVRAAFGEDTGNASAKQMADAWAEVAEGLRMRRNRAGGATAKLERWGLPQAHDSLKVRKVSFETWRDKILPKLGRDRMIDPMTGRAYSPERLELALREAFEDIRTEGFHSMKPSGQGGGRSLAKRRGEHRFLIFKDAESWMAYQDEFGAADPFSAMMGHIEGMARDIALMEILGPNPKATMRWMEQVVEKQGAELDGIGGATKNLDRARGKMNATINAFNAITDINFGRIAAAHAGIPQAKVLARTVKLLNPLDSEDKLVAVRLGLIAEEWSSMAAAQSRYVGDVTGPEISKRLSDLVMKWSALGPWTQAGRWGFGMEFLGYMAQVRGKEFDELNPALQSTLERYGIGRGSWDVIRATEPYNHRGSTFLRVEDLAERTDIEPGLADDLATRILEMVQTETEFAVPSASVRGRVMFTGGARPGTLIGEAVRSVAMYKNFSVTLMHTHIMRGLMQRGPLGKGRYFANLVISSTLMGALALQLKEISKGRDPRSMVEDPGAFWGAALIQGGGLGIFGDFLFSDVNRFGGSLAQTTAGPVFQFGDDVRRLLIGNALQGAGGADTNTGRELVNFLRRYTPGGSVWYARLGYERLIVDELQRHLDPRANQQFRARARSRARAWTELFLAAWRQWAGARA